ncbi:MAG: zinc ribbon domain-containing protein [Clostridiales bacterium]|jgi:hypothetical protein|nr:zinc ribbon domain-containing protein [Clostridiales bacterium]
MNDIRDTLTNAAKSVTKTSGDIYKKAKLNMSLSTEESKLKSLYTEIGKKVHEIYQYGGSLGKFFDEKYVEILTLERSIAEMKEQIGIIKGVRTCTKCGNNIVITSDFCPKCGTSATGASAATAISKPNVAIAPVAPALPEPLPPVPPPPMPPPPPEKFLPPPEPKVSEFFSSAPVENNAPILPQRNCRVCGTKNDIGTKFCLSCGRIVD